jgi:ATP-dependent helicase/nuclease subunit B
MPRPAARFFLDWTTPTASAVANFLANAAPTGDFSNHAVVVPTREAGRLLLAALADQFAQHGRGILPPAILTPVDCLRRLTPAAAPNATPTAAAPDAIALLEMAAVLRDNVRHYPDLFPTPTAPLASASSVLPVDGEETAAAAFAAAAAPLHDWHWALETAAALLRVRDTLSDSPDFPDFAAVARHTALPAAEAPRWADMARLETEWRERLTALGLRDKNDIRRTAVSAPEVPAEWHHLWLAATPEPTPLLPLALENAAPPSLRITTLVAAPETLAEGFDEWGRISTDFWKNRPIEWENFSAQTHLVATPDALSTALAKASAVLPIYGKGMPHAPASSVPPPLPPGKPSSPPPPPSSPPPPAAAPLAPGHWLTICAPDRDLEPAVARAAELANATARPPEGRAMATHWLGVWLRLWEELLAGNEERAVPGLLRLPEFFRVLAPGEPHSAALAEWDELNSEHLPDTLRDMREFAREGGPLATALAPLIKASAVLPIYGKGPPPLPIASAVLPIYGKGPPHATASSVPLPLPPGTEPPPPATEPPATATPTPEWPRALRSMLQAIFAEKVFDTALPADRATREVLEALLEECAALEPAAARHRLPAAECLNLLRGRLSRRRVTPEPTGGDIPILGWLELLWDDAPALAIAGLNDEYVPGAVTSDPFLPGSFREKLGLPSNDARLAAGAYTLQKALAQRRDGAGRVDVFILQADSRDDPLRPSRLLFLAPEDELSARATFLFGDAPRGAPEPAWRAGWLFTPTISAAAQARFAERISVTRFRDYLDCPFRFYLKSGLGMEPFDAQKMEPDAREFGSAIHAALEAFARDDEARDSADADFLTRFTQARLDRWLRARHGARLPLPVVVMAESARSRLAAFARTQAALRADGWRVCPEYVEAKFDALVPAGFRLATAGDAAGPEIRGKIDRIDFHEKHGWRIIDYKTSTKPKTPSEAHLVRLREDAPWPPDYARAHLPASGGRSGASGKEILQRWRDLQLPLYFEVFRLASACATAISSGTGVSSGIGGSCGTGVSSGTGVSPVDFSNIRLAYFNLPQAVTQTNVAEWEGYTRDLHESAIACARGVLSSIAANEFWPPNPTPEYDDFQKLFSPDPTSIVHWPP